MTSTNPNRILEPVLLAVLLAGIAVTAHLASLSTWGGTIGSYRLSAVVALAAVCAPSVVFVAIFWGHRTQHWLGSDSILGFGAIAGMYGSLVYGWLYVDGASPLRPGGGTLMPVATILATIALSLALWPLVENPEAANGPSDSDKATAAST